MHGCRSFGATWQNRGPSAGEAQEREPANQRPSSGGEDAPLEIVEATFGREWRGGCVSQTSPDTPEVSVVIPVYNEEERIEPNLLSLLSQQDAPSFEIIYVDDGSRDESWGKLTELSSKYEQARIRLHRLDQKYSIGLARNSGVRLAEGRVIANLDADCTVPPDWLANSARLEGNVGVVGFPIIPPSNIEYLHWRFHYMGTGQYAPGSFPHGCGTLIRKDLLLKAGNFPDTSLGEDTRLFKAINGLGAQILLLDRPAIHLQRKRTTLIGHLRRNYRMGRNAGPESRRLYLIFLGMTVLMVTLAVLLWEVSPWVSLVVVLANLTALANPRRVLQYVNEFSLPRRRISKVICFAGIKFLESLSILCGYVASLGRQRETRVL